MKLLDLTLPTPAENLALDEALLEMAEAAERPSEILRLWESPQPLVVLGRSSPVAAEVDQLACQRRGIPILRRCSGGATVLAGPGCLMYAVVLSYELRPQLQLIAEAHRLVMERLTAAIQPLEPAVAAAGICDLTLDQRKFSGNSMRCKRTHLLYHGTLLYAFPLALVAECLRLPVRQPEYRRGRSHADFLVNLRVSADHLRRSLIQAWRADELCLAWPEQLTRQLAESKYQQLEMTLK